MNGSFYVGSCEDINKRFVLHNKGLVKSTKRYMIVHKEEYCDLKSARRREAQIKSWKKRSAIEKIIENFKI